MQSHEHPLVAKKQGNPIDAHVGGRVRLRRVLIGMSQEKLGELLGLTFQQVQKYEKGTNRISSGRLHQIARILGVPVQFFFDDMAAPVPMPGFAEGSALPPIETVDVTSPEALQLCRYYFRVKDPKIRRRIVELVKALAGETDGDEGSASPL